MGALGALGASGAPYAAGASAGVGTTYLRARAAADVPGEIRTLLDQLKPLPRATRIERATHEPLIATVYQLVDRGRSAEFREQVEQIATRLPHLTLRVSGPSPAFAFTSE